MSEIYGLVEVSEASSLTFYFVTIELDKQVLQLRDRTDGKKPLNIDIPFTEIVDFKATNAFLTAEVSFAFEDKQYKFVEYGNKTISRFSQLLEREMVGILID